VLPLLENEDVDAPALAPYKKLYFQQYGGGPGAVRDSPVPAAHSVDLQTVKPRP
jgi:hypothetical protein